MQGETGNEDKGSPINQGFDESLCENKTSCPNLNQLLPTQNNEIFPCTELSFRKISPRQQQTGAQKSDIFSSPQKSMNIIPV